MLSKRRSFSIQTLNILRLWVIQLAILLTEDDNACKLTLGNIIAMSAIPSCVLIAYYICIGFGMVLSLIMVVLLSIVLLSTVLIGGPY